MFTGAGQPSSLHYDAVCEGGLQKGRMPRASLSASFHSLPLLPTIKLGPSGADSQVGRLVYVLAPCWCVSNELSCEAGSFSLCCLNPHRYSQSESLRLYFPWIVQSVLLPSCSSWFIRTLNWCYRIDPGWGGERYAITKRTPPFSLGVPPY